jgi:hypothetical protein
MSESVEVGLDTPRGGEVSELLLLLPAGDATALERAAYHRGLTVGQMLRLLVRDFLGEPDGETHRGG